MTAPGFGRGGCDSHAAIGKVPGTCNDADKTRSWHCGTSIIPSSANLPLVMVAARSPLLKDALSRYLRTFVSHAAIPTLVEDLVIGPVTVPKYTNEFWTSRQRQASSIHEISYRACFKPQLPRFFIDLLTRKGDVVYDPFSGRGTTVIEAGLSGRHVVANDANPLSRIMTEPRFFPPDPAAVAERLIAIPRDSEGATIDLSMFYHPDTEKEIVALRQYLLNRKADCRDDMTDRWIAMVATNRLTGHSKGFFSVYTLPPNQAVSRRASSGSTGNASRPRITAIPTKSYWTRQRACCVHFPLRKRRISNVQEKMPAFSPVMPDQPQTFRKTSVQPDRDVTPVS